MTKNKQDLTRIEDLGEFTHEPDLEEELPDYLNQNSEESSLEEKAEEDISFENDPFAVSEEAAVETNTYESTSSFQLSDFPSTDDKTSSTDNAEETPFELDAPIPSESAPAQEIGNDFTHESFSLFESSETENKLEESPSWEPEEHKSEPLVRVEHEYKAPETFEDLKKFSESSSFSGMATEGNPSFSVLVKNVRFLEDVNDIITLLREHGLLHDPEEQVKARLMRGMLLIPRVSEYAAIFLSHKLRRFDVDIQIGLSDEIHPPKHQETPETGIVSKHNLFQNQNHHFQFDDPKLELSQIIVAATPSLEGHQVLRYVGVASEHKMLESHIVEDENSHEVPQHYQELAQKLKAHALKAHANAVVGLNYQLTPIPSDFGLGGHKYRLTCTGNLVWVNKL